MQAVKVLFLCTCNSCRSQMAEGWARRLWREEFEGFSAGVKPGGMNPDTVSVMAEAGVDISCQRSKHLDDLKDISFDYVVTVCDDAREACPVFCGRVKVLHRAFDDPPRLAKNAATEAERLEPYRRVRDEIKAFIETLSDALADRKLSS
jgi:arsenate reductase